MAKGPPEVNRPPRSAPKEPRFGSQFKDTSSARSLDNVPNPGDRKDEIPPPAAGASYERAGFEGQPTKRIPGSAYKLEDPPAEPTDK